MYTNIHKTGNKPQDLLSTWISQVGVFISPFLFIVISGATTLKESGHEDIFHYSWIPFFYCRMDQPTESRPEICSNASNMSTLTVEDFGHNCNGHSSPDSGINDLSYEKGYLATPSPDQSTCPREPNQDGQVKHVITVAPDEQIRIQMGDTVRTVSGKMRSDLWLL